MKKICMLAMLLFFCVMCSSAQVIKLKAKLFSFNKNVADSISMPIYLPVNIMAVVDYKEKEITFHSEMLEEKYNIIRTIKSNKEIEQYQCLDPEAKLCMIYISVSDDLKAALPVRIRIVGRNSIRNYKLDYQ